MSYEDDPLVINFSRRFTESADGLTYREAGTRQTLRISWEEYSAAVERMRAYAHGAKVLGFVVSIGAGFLIFIRVSSGLGLGWFAGFALFLAGGMIRVISGAIGARLAIAPFRHRLLAEVREQRGWRRRGLIRGFLAAKLPPIILVIFVGLCILTAWVVHDHYRRLRVFAVGQKSEAQVTFSGKNRTHCQVDFLLKLNEKTFDGSITQCSIMDAHPTGSMIPVQYDPSDPGGVLAEGDSAWSSEAALPIMMWPMLLLIFFAGVVPQALGFAPRPRGRKIKR